MNDKEKMDEKIFQECCARIETHISILNENLSAGVFNKAKSNPMRQVGLDDMVGLAQLLVDAQRVAESLGLVSGK